MCRFTIPYSGPSDELVTRARSEIQGAGGSFAGDALHGNFEVKSPIGMIRGTYVLEANEISITITKKPLLVSCGRIERELREVLT